MSKRDDSLSQHGREVRRAETEVHLEKVRSIYKFHFFFAGLVFAILSFAIQFPVKGDTVWIKIIEAISWTTIGLTGILALKQIGGFSLEDTIEYHQGLKKNWRILMWTLFLCGIILLLFSKIVSSITSAVP